VSPAAGHANGNGAAPAGRRSHGPMRWLRRRDEVPVAELQRAKRPLRFGVALLVVLAIVGYFGFTKRIPFTHGYRLNAIFPSALDIAPNSVVRTAGVNVGRVVSIKRYGSGPESAGEVSMEISKAGLPIHNDATVKIRPRLFLEGNWFVELQPGSPSAPTLRSGSTLPITRASDPVQLDQVLDALNSDTRANLQEFLIQYGKALSEKPTPAEDAEQEPEVRGLSGAEALNRAARRGPEALRGAAIVNQALGGTHEQDLSTLIASINRVTRALDVHSQDLGELITNFNIFLSEFANQSSNLSTTVARLPGALHSANRAFAELDSALPPLRSFSEAIIPGVEETPATVAAFLPWIAQVRGLLAPSEFGGLARSLRESAPAIAQLTTASVPFYEQNDLLSQCLTNVLIPSGNVQLQDGASTSGESVFREFWYSMVGGNSLGQNFTGNGLSAFRSLLGSGGQVLRSAPAGVVGVKTSGGESLVTRALLPPLGTRPRFPASEPPYKPLNPCYKQAVPNFNGPLASGPADGSG
jgi:phospholipid/cholesterol/gamma-HCH transport system substrate-binding protein